MKTLIASSMIALGMVAGLSACSQPGRVWGVDGGRGIADISKPRQQQKPDIRWAEGKSAAELFVMWKEGYERLPVEAEKRSLDMDYKLNNIKEALGFRLRESGGDDLAYTLIREYALSKNSTGIGGLLPNIATCKAVEIYKAAQRKWGIHSSEYTNDGLIEMGIYHSYLYVMYDPLTGQDIPPPRESLCGCLQYSSGGCPK